MWYFEFSDDKTEMTIVEDDPEYSGEVQESPVQVDPSDREKSDKAVVIETMAQTWERVASLGNSPVMSVRAGYILQDQIQENIQRGIPDSL